MSTIELKNVWRCTGCKKDTVTTGKQAPSDMEAYSWRDRTLTHWCIAGQKWAPCELITLLPEELLLPLLERYSKHLNPGTRGPGRPKKMKVEA